MKQQSFHSYGDLLKVLQGMTAKELSQPVTFVEPYDKDAAAMRIDTIMPIEAARLDDLEDEHGLEPGDLVLCN